MRRGTRSRMECGRWRGFALSPVLALVLLLPGCQGDRSRADSLLGNDLALASQSQPVTPALGDTARAATPPSPPPTRPRAAATAAPKLPTPSALVAAPEATATAPAPAVAEAPAPPPFRGMPAGAVLDLSTNAQVCTTNLPGDKITATVLTDVVGEDGATIPAGTTVVLEVAEAEPGATPDSARISLRIRSVLLNDSLVSVPSSVAVRSELERRQVPRDKGADRRKVVGGAVAGAIVGQVLGRDTRSTVTGAVVGAAAGVGAAAASRQYDACLPAAGRLRATVTESVALPK